MKTPKSFYLALGLAMTANFNELYSMNNKLVHPNYNNNIPKSTQKKKYIFNINGDTIEAYSRKDAIKRYNHKNKKK